MSKFRKFFFLTCTLIMFGYGLVNAKGNRAYIVDSSITQQVDKKVRVIEDNAWFSTDFRMYHEDTLLYDTYASGKSSRSLALTALQEDTIRIAVPELTGGFDYQIILFKDTCIVKYSVFPAVTSVTYRVHKDDSLQSRLNIPLRAYTLRLSKKPTFSKGEVFDGIIELTSEDYYGVIDGAQSKYRMELRGYFRKPGVDKFMGPGE